jgi:hypothetical protein
VAISSKLLLQAKKMSKPKFTGSCYPQVLLDMELTIPYPEIARNMRAGYLTSLMLQHALLMHLGLNGMQDTITHPPPSRRVP